MQTGEKLMNENQFELRQKLVQEGGTDGSRVDRRRSADPSAIEKAEMVRVTGLSMRQVKARIHASCIYSQLESFSLTLSVKFPSAF